MAERICRQALNANPRDANLLCLLGASLIQQRKPEEAEHTLSRAVRIYPDFSRAHEGLAESMIMQGRLREALDCLERAEKLEPGSASIRTKKAKVLTGLGKHDEATREFEESFKLTPHREDLVRGMNLQRMGNPREAEKIYRDVLLRDPGNVDALRLLASVAMRAKQWGDAEALLDRALEIAPDFSLGWMDIGLARQEQDKTAEAIDAFNRVIQLEPAKPNGYVSAGTVKAMIGEHDEAQILVGKAPVIVDVRSRREYEAGHIPGAIHVSFWSTYWNADRIPVSGHDPVVVYCAHGPRAGIAGWGLGLAGIPNVVMLKGHMKEWAKLAQPVVKGEYPE